MCHECSSSLAIGAVLCRHQGAAWWLAQAAKHRSSFLPWSRYHPLSSSIPAPGAVAHNELVRGFMPCKPCVERATDAFSASCSTPAPACASATPHPSLLGGGFTPMLRHPNSKSPSAEFQRRRTGVGTLHSERAAACLWSSLLCDSGLQLQQLPGCCSWHPVYQQLRGFPNHRALMTGGEKS
jgi:hypothetical protein